VKLHNIFSNDNCIGKIVTAYPKLNETWIRYSDSNDGESNYYRDAFVNNVLVYCYGETCKIESYDEQQNTVTLSNDNINDTEYPKIFTISYNQYMNDFGLQWM